MGKHCQGAISCEQFRSADTAQENLYFSRALAVICSLG